MKETIDPIKQKSLIRINQQNFFSRSHYSETYDILSINFESLINSSAPLTSKKAGMVKMLLKELISHLSIDYNEILKLTLISNRKKFQIYNSINVCLLSLLIGRALNYSDEELLELGFAALMHDIGMFAMEGMIYTAETFSKEQRENILLHPSNGLLLLDRFTQVTADLEKAVIQEHEREDGSGYPEGIHGKNIHEFAKIIAIADCFEALTHFRPYRKCARPYDAMQTVLQLSKSQLDRTMANSLVNALSVYPPGTCVRLASGEVGMVTKVNEGAPLSPVVSLCYDRDGHEIKESKTIDLQLEKENYIMRVIDLELSTQPESYLA
jgi:HD-GYP domain-containing protein (c-di-GMP phosphodiesterase class II)